MSGFAYGCFTAVVGSQSQETGHDAATPNYNMPISDGERYPREAVVPITIITAPVLGCTGEWIINLPFVFFMGNDLEGILGTPIGQPFATFLFNSVGKRGSLVIWCSIIPVQYAIWTCILIASSRQTFAFARDGALLFSNLYPVNGVIFAGIITWLLGLLTTASAQAIFSLSVCAQYVAYSIPVTCDLIFKNDFLPGPSSLGRWSIPVAVIAVAWMVFTTTVLPFPVTPQTNSREKIYTVVVLGRWNILSFLGYYFPKYGGATSSLDRARRSMAKGSQARGLARSSLRKS